MTSAWLTAIGSITLTVATIFLSAATLYLAYQARRAANIQGSDIYQKRRQVQTDSLASIIPYPIYNFLHEGQVHVIIVIKTNQNAVIIPTDEKTNITTCILERVSGDWTSHDTSKVVLSSSIKQQLDSLIERFAAESPRIDYLPFQVQRVDNSTKDFKINLEVPPYTWIAIYITKQNASLEQVGQPADLLIELADAYGRGDMSIKIGVNKEGRAIIRRSIWNGAMYPPGDQQEWNFPNLWTYYKWKRKAKHINKG